MYYWLVLISEAGCKGNNGKNGYLVQGLVAYIIASKFNNIMANLASV